MKSEEAIKVLNACIDMLEVIKKRVGEIENDEVCLYATPHSSLRGSSDHIDVALSRIRVAVKWQVEAELEQQRRTNEK